jgi:hypothetical protein
MRDQRQIILQKTEVLTLPKHVQHSCIILSLKINDIALPSVQTAASAFRIKKPRISATK